MGRPAPGLVGAIFRDALDIVLWRDFQKFSLVCSPPSREAVPPEAPQNTEDAPPAELLLWNYSFFFLA